MHLRDIALLCAFVAALCGSSAAVAAAGTDYPNRPIRLVLPFAPGGSVDALARVMTPRLSEAMGQQWVIDNRGGAGGNIAAEIVARAAPDGYTVLLGLSTVITANPSLYKLGFSMERDLQAVTQLATSNYILVVNPGVPANTAKELVAAAKQKPGSITYSSGGVGTPLHLAAELFQKRAGIRLLHIPYKGGGAAAAAVLSGEAQMIFASFASSLPQVKAKRLKALATTGVKRSALTPDVPTMIESGFPGFELTSWFGLLVPAGTSRAVIERIRREAIAAMQTPDVQQAIAREGLTVEPSTPEALARRIHADTVTWAEVIKSAGIRPE